MHEQRFFTSRVHCIIIFVKIIFVHFPRTKIFLQRKKANYDNLLLNLKNWNILGPQLKTLLFRHKTQQPSFQLTCHSGGEQDRRRPPPGSGHCAPGKRGVLGRRRPVGEGGTGAEWRSRQMRQGAAG